MEIRDFIVEFRAEYLIMARQFYDSGASLYKVPDRHFEDCFDKVIAKNPLVRGLMIFNDGVPAGYAMLTFTYSCEAGGMIVWVDELYIKEEFRGMGLGTKVFSLIESEYKGVAQGIRLEVCPDNKSADALYRRLGFKELSYNQRLKWFGR